MSEVERPTHERVDLDTARDEIDGLDAEQETNKPRSAPV